MAGTVSDPIFVKDGQYLTFTADSAVTLGQVVELTSTGVVPATIADDTNVVIGVAVAARRYSRTQTDDSIAAGELVNVCTRGVVNVYTGTSAIVVGSLVEAGAAGIVELLGTNGTVTTQVANAIGMALEANGSAAATIKIKLLRG